MNSISVHAGPVRILVLAAVLLLSACAGSGHHRKSCWHLDQWGEREIGYCQAVRSGNTLYVSGSVGVGDMATAIDETYRELGRTLQANGLTFADVVNEHVYTTDMDAFVAHSGLRKRFYGNTDFPSATWVGVQRLFRPEFVLEVELIAEYP